jgi:nicotinamidase-related amidase
MALHIRPRYARLDVDEGQDLTEDNFHYTHLDWDIPLDKAAVITLDCWAWHYSRQCRERIDQITRERIGPLLAACREHGLQIIHAPAGPVTQKSKGWVNLLEGVEPRDPWPGSPDWPPAEFRRATGDYARYARPSERHDELRDTHRETKRWYHPSAEPIDGEAVILNGEELHRLCHQRGILHLFYVGFNTNACMIYRDYSIKEMIARGYHGILLRDATTGMELADTVDDMICTRGQIASLEQFGAYTLETEELINALRNQK